MYKCWKALPTDVYVPVYENGLPAAIDIGVTHSFQNKYEEKTAKETLITGNAYSDAKWEKI